jgi:signal transduction histidine kinase
MSAELLLATAATVVSLYAALFHAGVFALHRRAHDHAWAALAAASAGALSWGTALAYDARTFGETLLAQQIQCVGAPGLMLGGLRFTLVRLGVEAPRLARSASAVAAAVLVTSLAAPELLFDLSEGPRRALLGGRPLPQRFDVAPLGVLGIALVTAYSWAPLFLSARAFGRRRPGSGLLLACFGAATLAGISDAAVGLGLYDFPYLMPTGGYVALAGCFSWLLLRDLVQAMDESERLGLRLQDQARARADELRAIDLQLARGEQLAAIGMLAAGVAHEINNPLAYVSANLNQLRALWEDRSDSDEVKEILYECREGIARVGTIVSDLLRMARQGESESEVCDLGDVVRAVLPLVVREAGPEIEVVTDVGSPLPVFGNARLLGQVVLNLALNAIHAVPAAPDRPPRIELSAHASRGSAELHVCDNGPGIPNAVLGQIFEPSFTTKPEGAGTGLGLALTRLVVTRHRGEIEVESGPEGTAVTVRLPLVREGAAP